MTGYDRANGGETLMTGDTRARLAQKMDERRLRLRRSWAEIARRAGMDESNLRRIRNDKIEISELAAVGLQEALELKPGSIRAFLVGAADELTPLAAGNWPPKTVPASDQDYSPAGYVAAILDELAEKWGEEVLQEAWRLRESKKDPT